MSADPPIPTYVLSDRTLRLKIIDACGMACTFCHNEGTPVVVDNRTRSAGQFVARGASGRVSIYVATNGTRFLPAMVEPSDELDASLSLLKEALDLDELHLTGGEPTLHPRLAEIVRTGTDLGMKVAITSNGERGATVLEACMRAGLHRINFSIFGTKSEELVQVQHRKFADLRRAGRKIVALRESIHAAERAGVRASANIVVPNYSHAPRVHRLLNEYSPWLSVRLLNSLDDGEASTSAIRQIFTDLEATPIENYVTAGVSGTRTSYLLPDGRVVWFKQIRRVRLPRTCKDCHLNNDRDCQEGFYGVRLYRSADGGYQVGVCIQRMDLCMRVEDFVRNPLCEEILELRRSEYRRLATVNVTKRTIDAD